VLVYRVFAHDPAATSGEPGHWNYLHLPAQGNFRLDNVDLYQSWYFSGTSEAAIGESFGDLGTWSDVMFDTPYLPAGRRVLGVFEIPDDTAFLDLDNANHLAARALRPTEVISRVRPATQAWARNIFNETDVHGNRLWRGVRWWSYHRPHWIIYGTWIAPGESLIHKLVNVEQLSERHPAVRSAQSTLARRWH